MKPVMIIDTAAHPRRIIFTPYDKEFAMYQYSISSRPATPDEVDKFVSDWEGMTRKTCLPSMTGSGQPIAAATPLNPNILTPIGLIEHGRNMIPDEFYRVAARHIKLQKWEEIYIRGCTTFINNFCKVLKAYGLQDRIVEFDRLDDGKIHPVIIANRTH